MTMPTRRTLLALPLASPALAQTGRFDPVMVGRDGWLFANWESLRPGTLPATRRVSALLAEGFGLIARAGIQVSVALVPTRARIYPEFLPAGTVVSPDAEARYGVARDAFRAAGAIVPDMAEHFLRIKQGAQEPVFFLADTHWRPWSAYLAAEEHARAIAPGLPASTRPGTRLGAWGQLTFREHILANLLPPAQRAAYPAERYRVRMLPPAQGGLLDGDTAEEVMVLGDSFALPNFGFTPMLSMALNRPVGLFHRTGNHGHWKRLTDYLEGELFRTRRPRAIIILILEGNLEHMPDQAAYFGPNAMPPAQFISRIRGALA